MDNIKIAKRLLKVAGMLVQEPAKGVEADENPKDKIWRWLNSNTSFYSNTGFVSVGFKIEPRYAGDYPVEVVLCTTIKDFFQGKGSELINDIKQCQSKIQSVEKGLERQFPGIVVKTQL